MFDMLEIGEEKVVDADMIEWVANRVTTNESIRLNLFASKTIDALKIQLEAFDKMQGSSARAETILNTPMTKSNRNDKSKSKQGSTKPNKCYNCGHDGHTRNDCPARDKGKKCFNCDMFWHVAKDCRRPTPHLRSQFYVTQ